MNYRLSDVMGRWKTPDFRWRTILFVLAIPLALLILVRCSGTSDHDKPLRLVDEFRDAMVKGSPTQVGQTEPLSLWDFSREAQSGIETPANLGWMVGDGVTGLSVHQGRLKGKTRTDFPVIYVKRTSRLDEDDLLHSVEVRMKASDGTSLRMSGAGPDPPNFEEIIAAARGIPWLDTTPILPGDNFQTYTIPVARPAPASQTHHVFISPTDAPGADFEIESVRLVTRKEHLSRIPSGVSWQGLSDIYREALVSRSPESIEVPLRLPERPWLDLGIGTPEDGPVTFTVHVVEDSGTRLLRRRTVTTPHRWESVPLDLSEYGGREISLRLSLSAAEAGRLGFWGSPAIRSRGQRAGAESGNPQGVILIVADTLRADHLNSHGYGRETAPFLTEMASRGALFKNSIAQATWTKVSVPSIVTSLYPTSHRVIDFDDRLPAAATTLAEVYREAGYATVAYSSVLFSGKFTNLHQGYEELHESGSTSKEKPSKTAREYVDRLAEWLEIHRDGPFFAFLHVFDPHDPYEPHRPYNSMWADLSRKKEHEEQLEQVRKVIQDPLMKRFGMPSREELLQAGLDPEAYVDYDIGWYDGSIRAMDAELARLVERLEDLGLAESTLLVFTSDHGEEFLDHGKMFHGQSVYGELSRVPLLFFQPGRIREGVAVEETVQTIDIMPTLLELSGLSGPGGLMGQSLVPLMVSRESESAAEVVADWSSRPSITEKNRTGNPAGPAPRDIEQTAIIYDGWKLVVTTREDSDDPTRFELFRQPDDPLDQENRADQHPKVVQELKEMLVQWRETALAARLTEEDPTTGMSQEELQRLKSLGYIQ